MKPGKRIFVAVLIADSLAFLAFFGIAAFRRQADIVIPLFAMKWELAEACLGFIEWLPALHFLAVALALGSIQDKAENILKGGALPAILLSAIFSAAALLFAPGFETSRASVLASSARFNASLESTRRALDANRVIEARAAFGAAEAIDRGDPRTLELRERLLGAEAREERNGTARKPASPGQPKPDPAAAAREFATAAAFFRQKDFYNAHWHAGRAFKLDPTRMDAKKLADQAWGEILAQGQSDADNARALFYARKVDAFARLKSGDSIGAFGLFTELAAESPGDIDAARYLEEALAAVQMDAFFKDEADAAANGLSFPDFSVSLPGPKKGQVQRLKAREIAFSSSAAYLFDVTWLESGPDGAEQSRISSPYAKLSGGRIFFEAVERQRPSTVYRPELSGRLPLPAASEAPPSLAIDLDSLTAYRLKAGQSLPASLGAEELFSGAAEAPRYGVKPDSFIAELLRRLGLPFLLFGATVLGALIGIRFRSPEEKPSALAWCALPVMAGVTAFFYILATAMDTAISAWTIRFLPDARALIISAGIRFLILAGLLLLTAGLSRNDADGDEDRS